MNEILNRIHLGIMGRALCHATYGWFCAEISVYCPEIFSLEMGIVRHVDVELEL